MKVINIPLELIDEDLDQPRNNFDEEALSALVQSIKEVGLLNPIKVYTRDNGRYKIIFGNRRFKVHQVLGYKDISCIISDNESEEDIFLQQLTENIQRENFSPIEEGEAFKKAIENPKWNMSLKYLANKLGQKEKYISDKISLLNFGKSVRMIIHGGTEIIPNKLSESQVLPLKDLPVEYRDQIAMKVASEKMPVEDVKKISKLFTAKDIDRQNKENFLNYDKYKLIEVWDSYEFEKKLERIQGKDNKEILKPKLVNNEEKDYKDIRRPLELFPIEEKARILLSQMPKAMTIPDDVVFSFKEMKIDNREEFMISIDAIIENLEMHLTQWKTIKEMIKKDGVRRIK